jgi:LmbE family N-acetylglucosaminyl deacetylase
MKKVIIGIFAHPDDEAFGPCGTLLMEKAASNEIHLICATSGQSGMNPDGYDDLGAKRLKEWQAAGELLGADSMNQLGYQDGMLSNNLYMEVAGKIETIVAETIEGRSDIESIEFMSLDLGGLTGHLDHIFMSRVACYVFYKLKAADERLSRIRLACLSLADVPASNTNWLYMDAGRAKDEVGETIDASEHLEKIDEIMRCHHSQRKDYETVKAARGDLIAVNHFVVLT